MNADATTRQVAAAAALAPQAEGEPQVLTSITDEEILALTGDEFGFDLPWITARESRASGFSRQEAKLSAARSLIARGLLAPEGTMAALERREPVGDPGAWAPNILLTGIMSRRALVPLHIRVDGPTFERVSIVSLFVDHDGSVLQELISPDGIHHFVMSDTRHAAQVLKDRLDPGSFSDLTEEGDVYSGTYNQLAETSGISQHINNAEHQVRVKVSDRRDQASVSLLTVSGPTGVAIMREASLDTEGAAPSKDPILEGTAVSMDQLAELALSLLEVDPEE